MYKLHISLFTPWLETTDWVAVSMLPLLPGRAGAPLSIMYVDIVPALARVHGIMGSPEPYGALLSSSTTR